LHDESGILVALLTKSVKLSNSIVKSLLCEVARLVWGIQDLVVEDREVQGETKTDRMRRGEVG